MPGLPVLIVLCLLILRSDCVGLDRTNADPITWQVCPPGRTDIREGSLATIRCEAKLESEAKGANNIYRWEFRKEAGQYSFKRLSPHQKLDYNPTGAAGDLHIRSVDRDDDGKQFLCLRGPKEANKLTRCPKETTLKVFWLNPNVTVTRLQPVGRPLRQHDRVVLECSVKASEAPMNVRWFFNGKILCLNETRTSPGCLPLSNEFGGIYKLSDMTRLVIENLTMLQAGVYHCYVEAAGGRVLTRNPMPVFFDDMEKIFGKPVIYARENERIVLEANGLQSEDDKMWFTLKTFGYPSSEKNIEPITKSEENRQILPSEGLELTNNRWKLDRTELRISEGFSGASHFYLFRVHLKKKKALVDFLYEVVQTKISSLDGNKNFEPPLHFRSLLVPVGETFVQRVYLPYQERTSSQEWIPMPSVTWTTPSGEVAPHEASEPTARIRIVRDYHLQIERTQKSDTGPYAIKLSNPAGSTEMTMRLLVTYPPVLSKSSSQVTANEDTRFIIQCPYGPGDLVEQVTVFHWYKYGPSLMPLLVASSRPGNGGGEFSVNHNLEVNPDTGALTFRSVSLENAGNYACLAVTTVDELGTPASQAQDFSGNITLQVVRKFTLCPNQSNKVLLEQHIQQSLECRWYGEYRPSMTWYRRSDPSDKFRPLTGADRPGSDRPSIEVNEDGTKVTFHYVTQEMRGEYQVVAEGRQGRLTQVFQVAVGARPVFKQVSANQTVAEGAPARLDCEAVGSPVPTITWTFRRTGLQNGGKALTLAQFGPGGPKNNIVLHPNGTLLIREVSAENDGEYQCLAATEYALVTYKQLVFLRVLDPSAGSRGGAEKTSMMKTVIIVVSCAVFYLSLIVFLSIYCTFRMQRKRQKRSADMQMEQQQQQQQQQLQHQTNQQMHLAPGMSGGGIQLHNGYAKKMDVQHEGGGYYESAGRSIPPEYKSLLSQSTKYSPPRQTAEALEMMQPGTAAAFDCRSVNSFSGISSSLQSTYGRLHTNTPANSMIESTIERICRMHQVDRKKIVYRAGILGRGLFGAVRIGTLNGVTVLVKELASDDPNNQAEFIEQVKMFSKCDHDYVTRLAGVCIDNSPLDLPLMMLEYCEYNNLYEVLTGLKKHGEILPEDHLLRMCLQVAQALEHFHCLGFVHGDLGCRNVLVTQEYNLKLTNLGPCLDRFTGQYARNGAGALLPVRWLPPETVLHGQFGIKTDVWSFGVLACEIFGMGRRPFARMTDAELLQAAQKPDFRPDQPENLPRELAQVLDRCWSPSPDRRPTAGQIVAEVSELTKDMADV